MLLVLLLHTAADTVNQRINLWNLINILYFVLLLAHGIKILLQKYI